MPSQLGLSLIIPGIHQPSLFGTYFFFRVEFYNFAESERYKSWIRQHLDLQTVQSRLDRGGYEDCVQKFFRDLLLLFNNGLVFFHKSSSEHVAARELRAIVRKELNHKLRKSQSRTVKPEPSREPDTIFKPSKQSSMVVCGKRSSMKTLIAEGAHTKVETRDKEVEEKPDVSRKKNDASFVKIEEKGIRKKRTKEILGRRSSRTSNKGGEMKHEYGVNELSSHDSMEVRWIRRKTR
ncbi:hypothetical protein CJ030_MR1G012660 [Morella rubra]|uniref:Bromo domain-containing protein n=1 Tax=Morella rubra TaxID=262757 RepID=A0A6A1WT06_9ROSI|nr:hypothetical protein CJ030_MR1G012660 [Morella rubra]